MPFTSDARNRRRKHLAISLVETLVVIAVVGILIALILPAMQSVRGHSRRTQCRNNLHLLGLAMHNYHSKHKTFPPGLTAEQLGDRWKSEGAFVAASPACDDPASARATALTMVLPFLEEHTVHRAYNIQLACCAKENATATSSTVRAFVCPANPRNLERIVLPFHAGSTGLGPTDYVLSLGGNGLFDWNNPFALSQGAGLFGLPGIMKRSAGAFGVNRAASIEYMKDGTSNTFLMGESAGGPALFVGLSGNSIVEGAQMITGASTSLSCDNPWSMAYIASRSGVKGFGSVFAATAWNAWYDPQGNLTDHANGVNWYPIPINEGRLKFNRPTWAQASRSATDVTGTNGMALPSSLGSAQGFRSYHPNMANFLLGDGSVRSFTDHTDAKILVAFSSIVGKEPIDPVE